VAGVHSGPSDEVGDIVSSIKKSRADVVYVAYGAPKQEKWLAANLSNTGCKIGIGVGGTFDFIAGIKPRAPIWIQKLGFEWLYRLAIEPKRIIRQMAIPNFIIKVFLVKLRERHD
jgi:N-acetylglucosaminyldiphosphoundecaprenol N-acetyl-beta-D-mannosaminyltransferase